MVRLIALTSVACYNVHYIIDFLCAYCTVDLIRTLGASCLRAGNCSKVYVQIIPRSGLAGLID